MSDLERENGRQPVETPNWEAIFEEPVLASERIGGGYANDVWQVETQKGEFVVKISLNQPRPERAFWDGVEKLFGLNIYNSVRYLPVLADFLRAHSPLKVPDVYLAERASEEIERPHLILERVPGSSLNLEEGADRERLARQLGEHVASIHSAPFENWGCYPRPRFTPREWSHRLSGTIEHMALKWYTEDADVQAQLERFLQQAEKLAAPAEFVLIFPDFRDEQFLEQDDQLVALVDVESQVIGPAALDFIVLEHSLPPNLVAPFVAGYEQFLPVPELGEVRPLYRYLYFLIKALGDYDYAAWMDAPVYF